MYNENRQPRGFFSRLHKLARRLNILADGTPVRMNQRISYMPSYDNYDYYDDGYSLSKR